MGANERAIAPNYITYSQIQMFLMQQLALKNTPPVKRAA